MKSLGQIAYEAYCSSRNWHAFNGDLLPQWDEMKPDPRRADLIPSWEAAGAAVEAALEWRADAERH